MKISQELKPTMERTFKDHFGTGRKKEVFRAILGKEQLKLQRETLQTLFLEIETQGDKLIQTQTVKELQQYKQLVQRFVQEAVHFGMALKQSRGWNQQGRMQTLSLVKTIDEHLLELTEAVLEKGKSSIDLLEKVGEIKGLLINLYS